MHHRQPAYSSFLSLKAKAKLRASKCGGANAAGRPQNGARGSILQNVSSDNFRATHTAKLK